MITKQKRPKQIWVNNGREFTGEFKNFGKLKNYNFTHTICDTRAAFAERKIQSLEKYTTVTWKILDMSSFTNCLNSSQLWNPEKFVRQSWYKKYQEFRQLVHSVQQATTRKYKTQVKNWRQSSHLELWLALQEGLQATIHSENYWNCCVFFQKTSNIHKKGWTGWDYPR